MAQTKKGGKKDRRFNQEMTHPCEPPTRGNESRGRVKAGCFRLGDSRTQPTRTGPFWKGGFEKTRWPRVWLQRKSPGKKGGYLIRYQ